MPAKDSVLYYYKNKEAFALASKKCYESKKGTFKCQFCQKGLSSKQSLKRHESKSCPEKP